MNRPQPPSRCPSGQGRGLHVPIRFSSGPMSAQRTESGVGEGRTRRRRQRRRRRSLRVAGGQPYARSSGNWACQVTAQGDWLVWAVSGGRRMVKGSMIRKPMRSSSGAEVSGLALVATKRAPACQAS